MSYLERLGLAREPFSNSPDPDTFYDAASHVLCLNRLEIAVRLRRGLNVVLGPVGTGKSTLCRRLYRRLRAAESMQAFCLFDAGGSSAQSLLASLTGLLNCDWDGENLQEGIGKLQSAVFDHALVARRTLVLLIDEGQKLTPEALELLRVLLNFETNTEKLLQIVIFAQPEFMTVLEAMPNFRDRINECLTLEPLSVEDGSAMLRHRLRVAGGETAVRLFTPGALKVICRAGEGRPRQLIRLAHLSLLAMILAGRAEVDAGLVRRDVLKVPDLSGRVKAVGVAAIVAVLWGLGYALWQAGLLRMSAVTTALPPAHDEAPVSASAESRADLDGETEWVSIFEPVNAPADRATEPSVPMLGRVALGEHLSLAEVAERFYGSPKALKALRTANPDYERLGSTSVFLPELTFEVPARLLRNYQLAYGDFASPDEAYAAMMAWRSLHPRLVLRRDADGRSHYYLVARVSFSVPERAWTWLSEQKPPAGIRPQLLPPFRADEKAYCEFP